METTAVAPLPQRVASKPEVKRRVRPRKAATQIQELLNVSHALDKEPTNDLTIARMKFLQSRLAVLTKMQARERNEKLKRALAEVARLTAEVKLLRAESERLKKVESDQQIDPVAAALAKHDALKREGV